MLLCLLTGCTQERIPEATGKEEVKVAFLLGMMPTKGTDTRTTAPYTPEVENLIRDIWVLQFNENGILLNTETKYYPRSGESDLFVEDFEATLIAAQNSTVCLVINTGDADIEWPNNLPAFQRMLLDVQVNVPRRDRMPMCGYWRGDVTGGQALSVLLCRMMTRINLVLNNETGRNLKRPIVSLSNVPTQAYVYPRTDQDPLPSEAYLTGTLTDELTETIPSGEACQLYYYIAPNICAGEEHATQVTITADNKTWRVTLGTDAPDVVDRDYTLYANNYYTFTLNLK